MSMIKCTNCEKEYDEALGKCPHCTEKDYPHKFCQGCGKKLHVEADICPNCGFKNTKESKNPNDKKSFWLNAVGLFLPIIGFIMYIVLVGKYPKKAESLIGWTITGVITGTIVSLILGIPLAILYASYLNFLL